jgi:hypothetical protein
MGGNKVYFKRNKGTKKRRKKKNNDESVKTRVWAQPLVGSKAEPGRATVSST